MTAIPASLTALVNTLEAVPNVRVIKGAPTDQPSDPDLILVGYADEGAAVTYNDTVAGLGSQQIAFDIAGLISVWRGETDFDPAIDRADQLIEETRSAVTSDPTLGGVVTRARFTELSLTLQQTQKGAVVDVPFSVSVETFRY